VPRLVLMSHELEYHFAYGMFTEEIPVRSGDRKISPLLIFVFDQDLRTFPFKSFLHAMAGGSSNGQHT
jgi:hypothetical protein